MTQYRRQGDTPEEDLQRRVAALEAELASLRAAVSTRFAPLRYRDAAGNVGYLDMNPANNGRLRIHSGPGPLELLVNGVRRGLLGADGSFITYGSNGGTERFKIGGDADPYGSMPRFGQGNQNITRLVNHDFNTDIPTGVYDVDNVNGGSNAPLTGKWWYLEQLRHGNSDQYILQRATVLNDSARPVTFVRERHGGTWKAWHAVPTIPLDAWNISDAVSSVLPGWSNSFLSGTKGYPFFGIGTRVKLGDIAHEFAGGLDSGMLWWRSGNDAGSWRDWDHVAGTRPSIRAQHDANRAIPNSTTTRVQFNLKEYDTMPVVAGTPWVSHVSGTAQRYIVNKAGLYLITSSVSVTGTSGDIRGYVVISGTQEAAAELRASSNSYSWANVHTIYNLGVGAEVWFDLWQNSGVQQTIVGDWRSYFQLTYLGR